MSMAYREWSSVKKLSSAECMVPGCLNDVTAELSATVDLPHPDGWTIGLGGICAHHRAVAKVDWYRRIPPEVTRELMKKMAAEMGMEDGFPNISEERMRELFTFPKKEGE